MRVAFFVFALMSSALLFGQRIVSLSPSVTELIHDLGRESQLVGRTSYCRESAAVVVGDVLSVNIEKIVSLRPDIVVCVGFAKTSVVDKLRALGIKVQVYNTPLSFDEICRQTEEIGAAIGAADEAKQMVADERLRVNSLKSEVRGSGKKLFFQVGVRPLFSVVPNTYMQEFIDAVGCVNVSAETMPSREYVVAQKPDYIILTTMGGMAKDEQAVWQRLTKARTIIIDENIACCPTPVNYRKTLEELIRQMYRL